MGRIGDFFGRRSEQHNDEGENNYAFYEDTHSESGEYTARLRDFQRDSRQFREQPESRRADAPRNFQNFMVYEPRTADDVQTLIDFLKTRESAIINLDNVDEAVSQRVLDFVSGAVYALNGSVHRVASNIFLLSPEGVGITNSYELKNNAKQ